MKIEVRNLEKRFNNSLVLNNINLDLVGGKIYGFVGRNGSGKSVLLKVLAGFYEPTSGEVLYDDIDIVKNNLYPPDTRVFIEKPNFLPDLTGKENLILLASIQNKISEKTIDETLKKVNLYDEKDKKYHKYSLGMKQKLGIAQVLMENPRVMMLDEAFNGIDDDSAQKIRNVLLEEKEKGKIIILATHIKTDIDMLCDEVFEFKDGSINRIQ